MKKFTKLLGIVLIIALVMSMGTMALAADDGSITISDAVNGEKYNLWKVFDLTYGGNGETNAEGPDSETIEAGTYTPVSYTYTSGGASDQFLAALQADTSPFTLTAVAGSTTVFSVNRKDAATNQAIIAFVKDNISKLPSDRQVTPVDSVAKNNTVSWTGLPYGYYYATSSLGSLVTIDSTLKAVSIHDKNTITQQDKTVQEDSIATGENQKGDGVTGYGDKDDVDIGDTVYYKSTVTIGAHAKNVVFHDTMTSSLTFSGVDNVTVKVGDTDLKTTMYPASSTNAEAVVAAGTGGETFTVTFNDAWTQSLSSNTNVTITYSATLNNTAVIGIPTGENAAQYGAGNDNKSKVTFGNAQTTTEDWTRTYTWEVDIFKYTQSGTGSDATKTPVKDAKFVLYNSDKTKVAEWESAQGGLFKGWVASNIVDGKETAGTKLVTLDDGSKLLLKGLDADTYKLVEIEAPVGYNKLAADVEVLIDSNTDTAQGNNGASQAATVTIKQDNVVIGNVDGKTGDEVGVLNQSGTELPSTGGIGTTIFYVVGSILVVAAGVLLITKKRMSREG